MRMKRLLDMLETSRGERFLLIGWTVLMVIALVTLNRFGRDHHALTLVVVWSISTVWLASFAVWIIVVFRKSIRIMRTERRCWFCGQNAQPITNPASHKCCNRCGAA